MNNQKHNNFKMLGHLEPQVGVSHLEQQCYLTSKEFASYGGSAEIRRGGGWGVWVVGGFFCLGVGV